MKRLSQALYGALICLTVGLMAPSWAASQVATDDATKPTARYEGAGFASVLAIYAIFDQEKLDAGALEEGFELIVECESGPCPLGEDLEIKLEIRGGGADGVEAFTIARSAQASQPTNQNPWCGVKGSGSNKRLTGVFPVTQTAVNNCCSEHNISPCPRVRKFR